MEKLQIKNRFQSEIFTNSDDVKNIIIQRMLIEIATEMFKSECFEISETKCTNETPWINQDETEIKISCFVLSHAEYQKAIELFSLIKVYTLIPESLKSTINELKELILK